MIDKSWKLQRYDRKDYTELVEFPVEIVGRDGVIRRYSFEDAIRLYQRRISFAAVRYRDPDLALAESGHCAARVDQLRRSYFHRFGWATPAEEPAADRVLGPVAGELAAFLGRATHRLGRLDLRVQPVRTGADGTGLWYARPPEGPWGALLYVYRFPTSEDVADPPEGGRDALQRHLRQLEGASAEGDDTERLIAWHQTLDCGFVLTGDGVAARAVHEREDTEDEYTDLGPTPWDDAVEAIRLGEHALALRRCRDVVEAQPWHRRAWLAGAVLAYGAEDLVTAEELALVGSRYFPEDPQLRYWLAVARHRAGRLAEAELAAREAVERGPDLGPPRLLLARLLLRAGRVGEARQALTASGPSELRWLAAGLAWRARLGIASAACAAVSPLLAAWAPIAAGMLALAALIGLAGRVRLGRDIDAELAGARSDPPGDDIAHVLRGLIRRDAGPQVS